MACGSAIWSSVTLRQLAEDAIDRSKLADLIESSDLDGLVRFVYSLSSTREWDGLVELRERCAEAVGRGKPVWGASEYAAFRLALDAPGPYSGPVVGGGAGRHTPGPLWEVAASTHTWDEIEGHVAPGPDRSLVRDERVLRGEDLAGVVLEDDVLELPGAIASWEPRYGVATYRDDGVDAPEPELPVLAEDWPASPPDPVDHHGTDALYELVRPWAEESNGRVAVMAMAGTAQEAAGSVAGGGVRAAELTPSQALAWMAWAGASGGAHGRRRGGAVGRFNALWAVSELSGLSWPPHPDQVKASVESMRWFRFQPSPPASGWAFHLAAERQDVALAWAVAATDTEGA